MNDGNPHEPFVKPMFFTYPSHIWLGREPPDNIRWLQADKDYALFLEHLQLCGQNPLPEAVLSSIHEGGEMSNPYGIVILGANGSGKSTLGHELARVLDFAHFDVEEYYFFQTDIPYTAMRSAEERNEMLLSDMKTNGSFIMSGDISGWSEKFISLFDLVILLTVPANIRLKRIENREHERWGDRVRKGGDMYEQHLKFVEFAASRDIALIEKWASLYSCPILQVDGNKPLNEMIDEIMTYINTRNHYDALIGLKPSSPLFLWH
jgi:adenylate kinase family enzyme